MSKNPVLLETPQLKANKRLVKELRSLLEEAEAGKLEAVSFVAWGYDKNMWQYGFGTDITKKVGILTRMIHELLS